MNPLKSHLIVLSTATLVILFTAACGTADRNALLKKSQRITIPPGASVKLTEAFGPKKVSVKPGAAVTWINNDSVSHLIASVPEGAFRSGPLAPGDRFTHIFKTAGKFAYISELHPAMQGMIIVSEAASLQQEQEIPPKQQQQQQQQQQQPKPQPPQECEEKDCPTEHPSPSPSPSVSPSPSPSVSPSPSPSRVEDEDIEI